jgi:hypothetical protein
METEADSIHGLTTLRLFFSDEVREAVFKRIWQPRIKATPARRHLESILRARKLDSVKMDGFRDPLRAHTFANVLTLAFQHAGLALLEDRDLVAALLAVWLEYEHENTAIVDRFLHEQGYNLARDTLEVLDSQERCALLPELLQAFHNTHPKVPFEKAGLLLLARLGAEKSPDEEAVNDHPLPQDSLWTHFIEQLRAIPFTAPEWSQFEEGMGLLQQLRGEYAAWQAANQERHAQLLLSLNTFRETFGPVFDYHQIQTIHVWQPRTDLTASATEDVSARLALLGEKLQNHLDFYNSPKPTNRQERQQHNFTLEALETEIHTLYTALEPFFIAVTPSQIVSEPQQVSDVVGGALDEPTSPTGIADAVAPMTEHTSVEMVTVVDDVFDEAAFEASVDAFVEDTENILPALEVDAPIFTDSAESVMAAVADGIEEDTLPNITEPDEVVTAQVSTSTSEAPAASITSTQTVYAYTAEAIARSLQQDEVAPLEMWHDLLWALVAEDDLLAAAWLARGLEANHAPTPLPSWLLVAVQGSRWLRLESHVFVDDLLNIAKQDQPGDDDASRMMGLAAALRPALIAPATGMIDWLQVPSCCGKLNDLVNTVYEFSSKDIPLYLDDLETVDQRDSSASQLTQIATTARQWLDDAPSRRMSYDPASKVWRFQVGARGLVRRMLTPVIDNRREDVRTVREIVTQFENDINGTFIEDSTDALGLHKTNRIVGDARKQIQRVTREAVDLAASWCELIEREQRLAQREAGWVATQVKQLRRRIIATLPVAMQQLDQTLRDTDDHALKAAILCLKRAIGQVCQTLHLPSPNHIPASLTTWDWLAEAQSLALAVNRRLLAFPEIEQPADANTSPEAETLLHVAIAIRDRCVDKRSLSDVVGLWLERQDYRFVELLLQALEADPGMVDLRLTYHQRLEGSLLAVRERATQVADDVENALLNGIITEEDRARLSEESIRIVEDDGLNFQHKYARLKEMQQGLLERHQQRCDELRQRWEKEFVPDLAKSVPDDHQRQIITQLMNEALDRADTRVADEYMAQLLRVTSGNDVLEKTLFFSTPTHDTLRDFMGEGGKADSIEHWLRNSNFNLKRLGQHIVEGDNVAGIDFNSVPRPRRQETGKVLEAWLHLKGADKSGEPQRMQLAVMALAQYLGMEVDRVQPTKWEKDVDWFYTPLITRSTPNTRPIAQWGTQAEVPNGRPPQQRLYHVLVVWQRHDPATIKQRLESLKLGDRHNVMVIFLGMLRRKQRSELPRHQIKAVILDETLLIYLAQERDASSRLGTFLRCGLPFADLMPYTPRAGDVPQEMFFGREEALKELTNPQGNYVIYGGRQMGKTALLRQVQRLFHAPERDQYALYLDIKPIGSDLPTEMIWNRLWEGLRALELVKSRDDGRVMDAQRIESAIRQMLHEKPQRRLLILLDEADNFLDTDSGELAATSNDVRKPFPMLERLRAIMVETNRRFMLVLAGLHNVQRFQHIPNQPLAHFSKPIPIGPLDPRDAERLVTEPMEFLGYQPAHPSVVLRVLSYTNYHTGLLQIFCDELVRTLRSRLERGANRLPLSVTQEDVDQIYRNDKVRDSIRDRFNWTLALDTRYQAIAWSLIVDQLDKAESFSRTYTSREILDEVTRWWPLGFENVDSEKMRGLLDEMCGLGVLVRDPKTPGYRLRSPNLVRLIGTEQEIAEKLLELESKQPPVNFRLDTHHPPLDDAATIYSPFTYAQERTLNLPQSGVVLAFASDALNFRRIPDALRKLVPVSGQSNGHHEPFADEIPPLVNDSKSLHEWLGKYFKENPGRDRLIVYQTPRLIQPGLLRDLVRTAVDFCEQHKRSRRTIRIFFLFDTKAAWNWCLLDPKIRHDLEKRVDGVLNVARWERTGVEKRLDQHNIPFPEELVNRLMEVTGGWPMLLDLFFEQAIGRRKAADAIIDDLARDFKNGALRNKFWKQLGTEENEPIFRVLNTIWEYQPVSYEQMMMPGVVDDVSDHECRSAVDYLLRMGCLTSAYADGVISDSTHMLELEPVIERALKPIWPSS